MATPAKPEAAAAKAPAKEGEAPAPAAVAAPAPAKGGLVAWVPVIAALLLAPVATWATVEFVMLPRLQKKIAAAAPAAGGENHGDEESHAASAEEKPAHGGGEKKGGHGAGKGEGGAPSYQFENIVVNLSGTMGTRYLKTNIYVTGKDAGIKALFENDKPRLTDITQSVLASLTLADIEETGSRNVIRAKLINAYNEAFKKKVVEEVYLTDFVVQ